MFNVTLYSNFTKPYNSTKIPSGGEVFPCQAVESCSILSPLISFNQGVDWNPSHYNYATVEIWRRHYWITDWTWVTGRWYAQLQVDVLASWKDAILNLEEYVVRSAVQFDTNVIDMLYPAKSSFTTTEHEFYPYDATTFEQGCFVLGVANGQSSSKGGITYYVGSQSEMSALFEFMYSTTDWINGAEIDDISNDLLKCLVNPAQYLTSLMWFPIQSGTMQGGGGGNVGAGWWETGVSLNYAKDSIIMGGEVSRDLHPQSARGNYLNYAPYTEISVYIPPFGSIPLNPEKFAVGARIHYEIHIDVPTGSAILFLYRSGDSIGSGQQIQGQVGVPIALTSMTSDLLGGLTTIGNNLTHVQNIASAVFGTVGAVADAAKLISPDVSVVGTNGNVSVYQNKGSSTCRFKMLVDEDLQHHGRPLFKKQKLSNLSGFTQIRDLDTNLPCTFREQQEIKQHAERGFYIE